MRTRSTVTSVLQVQPVYLHTNCNSVHARNLLQTHLKATLLWPFLVFRGLGWAEQTRYFLPATYTFQCFAGHMIHIIPSKMLCACLCCAVSQQDFRMRALKVMSCKFLLLLLLYPWCPQKYQEWLQALKSLHPLCPVYSFCFEGRVAEGLNDI